MPALQFYANDWLTDEKLSACSLMAQGFWMRLLCLMHKNDRRGYLELNSQPPTTDQLARMTGCTLDETKLALAELRAAGVPSVDDGGVLYSRRMVRDELLIGKRRVAGALGGMAKANNLANV
jgi:hypothetical protein